MTENYVSILCARNLCFSNIWQAIMFLCCKAGNVIPVLYDRKLRFYIRRQEIVFQY